ncbi:MAG: ubiquinol-cytochrome c reductase cytochrome b subunit, partial [Cellulosimicrobium funkei]
MTTSTGTAAPRAAAPKSAAPTTPAGKAADYLDQRTGIGVAVKEFARKVFPDHWSFLLGEIALYSFVVLILTGLFLTLVF